MTNHNEYPKMVYRGSQGKKVSSVEEESAFLGRSAPARATSVTNTPVILTQETAIAYIMTKGYNEKQAKKVFKTEGLENIQKEYDSDKVN